MESASHDLSRKLGVEADKGGDGGGGGDVGGDGDDGSEKDRRSVGSNSHVEEVSLFSCATTWRVVGDMSGVTDRVSRPIVFDKKSVICQPTNQSNQWNHFALLYLCYALFFFSFLVQVTDLDVFRQLVLNRLTTDNVRGRRNVQSAGSSATAASPSSSSLSSSLRRSSASAGGPRGVRRGVEGDGAWGWQARQAQIALWVQEAAR